MALSAGLKDSISPSCFCCLWLIDQISAWLDGSFLELQVNKTKELCLGSRLRTASTTPVFRYFIMKGQELEQVNECK